MRLNLIAVILIFCFVIQASAQAITPKKQLRQQLIRAINNSKTADSLYKSLTAISVKTPVITGYIGTLQALKAKHSWHPHTKVKQVANAEKTFEKAIAADAHNLELRYLRYSVENNLPKVLGYSTHLQADKREILNQIDKHPIEDKELTLSVIKYLLQNSDHTPAEKIDLHKQLAALQ